MADEKKTSPETPEYEALKAAREMAAKETRAAMERVARVLKRESQSAGAEQHAVSAGQ